MKNLVSRGVWAVRLLEMSEPSRGTQAFMRLHMRKAEIHLSLVLTICLSTAAAHASTPTVLYNFCSQANCKDGANPMADLTPDLSGNLWGTTRAGGTGTACNGGCGTIFELTASSGFTQLGQVYSFKGGSADGAFPEAGLVLDTQTQLFYGTTSAGGTGSCSGGCGTIFEFRPGSTSDTILHFFGASGDGATPTGELLLDSSQNFYGTTTAGGLTNCNGGCGTVFLINPLNNTYQVLHKFSGSADGSDPAAGLVFDSKANLWGTARSGGAKNFGTVFALAEPGYTNLAYVHTFKGGANGANPTAALTFDSKVGGALGTLYGTTSAGGSANCSGGCGLIFELEISGLVFKNVYKLTGAGGTRTGSAPVGRLALDVSPNDPRIGHLYGTASLGGTNTGNCPASGCGTLFEVCPPTIVCTGYAKGSVAFDFDGTHGANSTAGVLLDVPGAEELFFRGPTLDGLSPRETGEDDGVEPQTGKGACTTNCIGTGTNGGTNGKGVVLKIKP
jgi:uncharacterized repeat protein (TIGR03803 family)